MGTEAAKMAAGLGADVTIMDLSLPRLRYLADIMPANVKTMMSNHYNIAEMVQTHDLIIGAVLIPGAKAPKLVTREMLKTMRPGTVLVDVAVDQGGCFETTHATTHANPTFTIDEVIHYCVANMPGAVPRTSTLALTNATLPYAVQLADKGWIQACRDNAPWPKALTSSTAKWSMKELPRPLISPLPTLPPCSESCLNYHQPIKRGCPCPVQPLFIRGGTPSVLSRSFPPAGLSVTFLSNPAAQHIIRANTAPLPVYGLRENTLP